MQSIFVRLAGGLGNQLFQLAAGLHLATMHEAALIVSPSGLSKYESARRPDALRLMSSDLVVLSPGDHIIKTFLLQKIRFGRWPTPFSVNDRSFHRSFTTTPGVFWLMLDGYFQDVWPKLDLMSAVKIVGAKTRENLNAIEVSDIDCAVHIRGGDFLKIPLHQVVDELYYVAAIKMAAAHGARNFSVITDDLQYAESLISKVKSAVADYNFSLLGVSEDCLVDFARIRKARIKVIGNSTFSWWACALDPERGLVISPREFVRNIDRRFYLPWEISIDVGEA